MDLLVEKENFESLSIVEICTKANIHRTTFYLHFQDKFELLDKCLLDILDVPESEVILYTDLLLEEKIFNLMKYVALNCSRHSDFLLLILQNGRYPYFYTRFLKELEGQIGKQIERINRTMLKSGGKMNKYCNVFLSSALFGSILFWAENGEQEDIDSYCRTITKYIIATLYAERESAL